MPISRLETRIGVPGRTAERLMLERCMTRLLERRNAWLKRQLEV